jgi:hypothetical protein
MLAPLVDGLLADVGLASTAVVSGPTVIGLERITLGEQAADGADGQAEEGGDVGSAVVLIGQFKDAQAERNRDGGRHGVTSWQ